MSESEFSGEDSCNDDSDDSPMSQVAEKEEERQHIEIAPLTGGMWEMLRRGLTKKIGSYSDQLEFVIKVRSIFDGFDEDGGGSISSFELRRALRHMGITVSSKDIFDMMQRYATNDEAIAYEEFEEMVKDLIPPPEFDIGGVLLEQKLRVMFQSMDSDGDLTLSPEEIRIGLASLGLTISENHVAKIVQSADKDNSGTVDFREFCMLYSKNQLSSFRAPEELEAIAKRFAVPTRIVRGSDASCRAGTQVMIQHSIIGREGFKRYAGVGTLTKPADDVGGRWYAKFPCAPETFFSTGRNGVYELTYARDNAGHSNIPARSGNNAKAEGRRKSICLTAVSEEVTASGQAEAGQESHHHNHHPHRAVSAHAAAAASAQVAARNAVSRLSLRRTSLMVSGMTAARVSGVEDVHQHAHWRKDEDEEDIWTAEHEDKAIQAFRNRLIQARQMANPSVKVQKAPIKSP